ncbi:MAG: restriction endonuclease subunit S, partial [Phaeodactylibacter sp.]|nr:restriction endonuclease subunit S [Phaeodactylibacter sp.]
NIAPKDFENGRVNQHVSIIRPKTETFLPIYLKYFLQSPSIQEWISNVNYGVTRQALTKSAQENLELPLPLIEEQHQIVQEIESRLSVCDKVEQSITESLEKAKALRQSILKKAFEGKLLSAAEIEACKAAPDYEPASVLLEKIKAEKSSAKAQGDKKKKK